MNSAELERRARLAAAIGPCTIDATAHLLAIENELTRRERVPNMSENIPANYSPAEEADE